MTNPIQLYIDDKEVIFKESPEILFTYQDTELTNPTVVKNSYTKSITIEGTRENNKVFTEIWKLDRIQNDSSFNPSQRVPFELFRNGEIIEQGYVKLDSINRTGRKIEYEITLYGGLGEVFYNLSYDSDGNKLGLADVLMSGFEGIWEGETLTINKDTIINSWDNLQYEYPDSGDTKPTGYVDYYHIVNFCPAYNGLPDGLDADKVLINTASTSGIKMRRASGSTWLDVAGFPTTGSTTAYTPYNGYALAELNTEQTEWQVRDLRSWCQRPAISVRSVFDASNRYCIDNGWEFDYDSSFFNKENPYWEDAWVTLPQLSNLEVDSTTELGSFTLDDSIYDGYVSEFPVDLPTQYETVNQINVGVRPRVFCQFGASDPEKIYTSCIPFNTRNEDYGLYGGLVIEIVAKQNDNVVAASSPIFCTSSIDGKYLKLSSMKFTSAGGYDTSEAAVNTGCFVRDTTVSDKDGLHCYQWSNVIRTSLTSNVKDATYYVRVTVVGQKNRVMYWGKAYYENGAKGWLWSNQYNPSMYGVITRALTIKSMNQWSSGKNADPGPISGDNLELALETSNALYTTPTDIKSNVKVPYETILNSLGCTPCEFILSYCKLFNIRIERDDLNNKIYFKQRGNYYDGKVIDIDKYIDRGSQIKISPLAFDCKWYDFKYSEGDGCEFGDDYDKTYGVQFGTQRVNTGYNFNSDSKDLLSGNTFNYGLQALEKSRYYIDVMTGTGSASILPSFFLDGTITYNLFNSTLDNEEITLSYPNSTTDYRLSSAGSNYDNFEKLQLHSDDNEAVDGAGVLCFFTGYKTCQDMGGYDINYCVSDDIQTMITLNDGLCWYWTMVNTANATLTNKLPMFSRNIMDGTMIAKTWDFGKSSELYVPDYRYGADSTLYMQYWNTMIEDEYDINTRVVECNVRWNTPINEKILKHFFYFDNCLWILSKVSDYNVSSFGTTKCKFLKVNNPAVYSNSYENPVVPQTLSITPTTLVVPASGGTFEIAITFTNRNGDELYIDHNESYEYLSWGTIAWTGDNGTLKVKVAENTGSTIRNEDYIKFESLGETSLDATLQVIQEAKDGSEIGLTKTIGNVAAAGGYNVVYVICDNSWTLSSSQSYVTFSEDADGAAKSSTISGKGDSSIRAWFEKTEVAVSRSAVITGTSGANTATTSIEQEGIENNAVYLSFNDDYTLYVHTAADVLEDIDIIIEYTMDDGEMYSDTYTIESGGDFVQTQLSLQDFDPSYGNYSFTSVIVQGNLEYQSEVGDDIQWLYIDRNLSDGFIEEMDSVGNTSYDNITWGMAK